MARRLPPTSSARCDPGHRTAVKDKRLARSCVLMVILPPQRRRQSSQCYPNASATRMRASGEGTLFVETESAVDSGGPVPAAKDCGAIPTAPRFRGPPAARKGARRAAPWRARMTTDPRWGALERAAGLFGLGKAGGAHATIRAVPRPSAARDNSRYEIIGPGCGHNSSLARTRCLAAKSCATSAQRASARP